MKIRPILLSLTTLALAFAGGFWINTQWNAPPPPPPAAKADPPAPPAPPVVRPPDLRALAAGMGGGTAAPTPAQIVEEQQTVKSQVEAAAEALRHIDPQERIGGAEQLAAYPTRESEALLTEAMTTDQDAEVRKAAAQSLQSIKSPDDKTIDALLVALADESAGVGLTALNTLQVLMNQEDRASARYEHLRRELQHRAKARAVPKDTRREIAAFLSDQTASAR